MAKECSLCGSKIGFFDQNLKFKDKQYICGKCIDKYRFSKKEGSYKARWKAIRWSTDHSLKEFKENYIDQGKDFNDALVDVENKKLAAKQEKADNKAKYQALLSDFQKDSYHFSHYYFNQRRQQILVAKTLLNEYKIINFSDIVSYRVNQNGHNETKHHGITRAIVGGALAGGVGAIVGATTGGKQTDYIDHLGLIISLKDGSNFEVVFIRKIEQIKSNSLSARASIESLNKLISLIDSIIAQNQASNIDKINSNSDTSNDSADEIRKFKKLAEDGIITQEEFEAKKKMELLLKKNLKQRKRRF